MINRATVGGRIREIRKERELTLTQLAEALGISHSHLSQVENDKAQPSRQLLLAIEKVFKVRYEWLETGEGPKQADVAELVKELLANYPKDVQISAVVEFAKAKEYEVLMDALLARPQQSEDPRFLLIVNFFQELWMNSDDRKKMLLETRLIRTFPEFEDYMTRAVEEQPIGTSTDSSTSTTGERSDTSAK